MIEPTNDGPCVGGIVLCGGLSKRMGYPKSELPFGDQTLLSRVLGVVETECSPVVVVAAAGQQPLKSSINESSINESSINESSINDGSRFLMAYDRRESRGPLEGIAAGMCALNALGDPERKVEAVYVTGCDVPLLRGDFIRRMIGQLRPDDDVAVPRCEDFHHPLAAVYRMRVLPIIQQLLVDDSLIATELFDRVPTREVTFDLIRQWDPELSSLENVNTPEQYRRALGALRI